MQPILYASAAAIQIPDAPQVLIQLASKHIRNTIDCNLCWYAKVLSRQTLP